MPDNHLRVQLCFMIQQYGQDIITELARCRDLLCNLAPQNRLEINLLIMALEQKIAEELLKPTTSIPVTLHLEHLAQGLHENQGTQLDFAYWAVESWALALNVIQQPVSKQQDLTTDPYTEAVKYFGQKIYEKALPLFKQVAEQGNAAGQNYLGVMYQSGYGVTKDYKQAVEWYRKAAEQGNEHGQSNLGQMYAEGWGVAQYDELATGWYRKSAEQGNVAAQCWLDIDPTEAFFRKYPEFFMEALNRYYPLDDELIDFHKRRWNWDKAFGLSWNEELPWSIDFIERYKAKWNWGYLSSNKALPWSEEFIELYKDKWDWGMLSSN